MRRPQRHLPGVTVLDVSAAPLPAHLPALMRGGFSGYQAKVAALYLAPYRHVLWLDSDSMPLADPSTLFALPQYRAAGALFWPDRFCHGNASLWPPQLNPALLYEGLGMPAPAAGEYTTESGQFLLDKARHADVLEWLFFLNAQPYTYAMAWGDKVGAGAEGGAGARALLGGLRAFACQPRAACHH